MSFSSLEEINDYFSKNIKSELFKTVTNVVPGEGNSNSDLMFVGEAPGSEEDKQGKPFVGSAGKFLDVLLESIDFDRSSVFITNIVKCRPPNNRDPSSEEKTLFDPWLKAQIDFINPKVFIPLGRHALWSFYPDITISKSHGKVFYREKDDRLVFVMYHPAVALYNGSYREVLLNDIKKLKNTLDEQKEKDDKIEQMKMF